MKVHSVLSFLSYIRSQLKNEKNIVALILLSILLHSSLVLAIPLITMQLIDNVLPKGLYNWFWISLIALVLFPLLSGILMTYEDYAANKLGHKVVTNIRIKIFSKYLATKYKILSKKKSGESIQKIIDEPEEIAHWIYITGIQVFLNLFGLIFIFGFLLYIDLNLGLISFLVFALFIIPYQIYSKKVREASTNLLRKRSQSTQVINENLNSMYTIKGLGIEEYIENKFIQTNNSYVQVILSDLSIKKKSSITLGIISALGVGLIYLLGGWKVFNNEITIGTVIASKMYIDSILIRGKHLYERLMQTLWKIPIANQLQMDEGIVNELEVDGDLTLEHVESIELSNVSFGIGDRQILKDINFKITGGSWVSIVGPSGCGKSSILYLITRISDFEQGEILINKKIIESYSLDSLRSKILLVPQKPEIISGTIRYNLTFGEDTIKDNEIHDILKNLNMGEYINQLPDGIDTFIEKDGKYSLSLGQIQRLAIARAIIQKPSVIILDESTSALDQENINRILYCLKKYIPTATVIFSTHDISLAEKSDRIIYFDAAGGWIMKTHTDFIESNSGYRIHFNQGLVV